MKASEGLLYTTKIILPLSSTAGTLDLEGQGVSIQKERTVTGEQGKRVVHVCCSCCSCCCCCF